MAQQTPYPITLDKRRLSTPCGRSLRRSPTSGLAEIPVARPGHEEGTGFSGHPPDRHGQGVRHANEQLSPPAAQLKLAIKDQFRALPAAGMISGGGCGTFACRGSGAAISSSTCEGCPLAIWRWPLSFRSFEALPSSQSSTASTAFPRRSLGACSVYDRAGRARRRCGALSTLFGRALSRLAQFARHQQQLGGAHTGRHVEQHIAEAAGKPTPQQREMPRPGVAKEAAAGQFRRCPRHPVS